MNYIKTCSIYVILIILTFNLHSKTIRIPVDFSTIQNGVDIAEEGDTVLVDKGVYNEQVKLREKNIVLKGNSDFESTILDGEIFADKDSSSLIYIYLGENNSTVIQNFTIKNGNGTYINKYRKRQGGAVHCTNSSFTLKNCKIIDNSGYEGGALYYELSSSQIINCRFEQNYAGYGGGSVYAIFSDILIENCHFINNESDRFGGGVFGKFSTYNISRTIMSGNKASNGGAIYSNTVNINFSTIINNVATAGAGGGIFCTDGFIGNSIIYFNNKSSNNNQIYLDYWLVEGNFTIEYCDIQNNWEGQGNFDFNPLLNNTCYALLNNSPCIDKANPESELDPDGTRADIGAFYYNQNPNRITSPIILQFTEVNIGTNTTKPIIVTNIYDSQLELNKIDLHSDNFSYRYNGSFLLAPGESSKIEVTFSPSSNISYQDSIIIYSNLDTNTVYLRGNGVIKLSGFVKGIWDKSLNPIIVQNDIVVDSTDTLLIKGGVNIKIKDKCKFIIYGLLLAEGNINDTIQFIGYNESSEWWGLQFINSNKFSVLNYCKISGANPDDNIPNNHNDEENGGGIYCYNSKIIVKNCLLINNKIAPVWSFDDGYGGGIAIFENSNVLIDSCNISYNAMSHGGGGIYSSNSVLILKNCSILNNYAVEYAIYGSSAGGGIYIVNSQTEIYNNHIAGAYNQGYQNSGGGICVIDCNDFQIKDNHIENNNSYQGGGIYIENSCGNINGNRISRNDAAEGGGLYIYQSDVILQKNIIDANNCTEDGAGLYILSGHIYIINNTIVENSINTNINAKGIGIYAIINQGDIKILNTIIHHDSDIPGTNIYGYSKISYSFFNESVTGEGNISGDPKYSIDSYILDDDSPCIDAGNPASIYEDTNDPNNPGYALYPSRGTIRNDIGAYGGSIIEDSLVNNINQDNTNFINKYKLFPNYPNPFNPTTTIKYNIPQKTHVILGIYNINGQLIETLVNKIQNPDSYSIQWNANNISSGIYFYRIQTGDYLKSRKMLVIK